MVVRVELLPIKAPLEVEPVPKFELIPPLIVADYVPFSADGVPVDDNPVPV